ncbi:DUF5316 family protein [Sutcliffiella rhizosphaerae]
MVDESQTRANFTTETAKDRRKRFIMTNRLVLIAFPIFIVAFLLYMFFS